MILSETDLSISLDKAVTLLNPRWTDTRFGRRESAVAGISRMLLSRRSKVRRLVKPSNASSSTWNKINDSIIITYLFVIFSLKLFQI